MKYIEKSYPASSCDFQTSATTSLPLTWIGWFSLTIIIALRRPQVSNAGQVSVAKD